MNTNDNNDAETFAVPPDKVLVVEYLSCSLRVSSGESLYADLATTVDGVGALHSFFPGSNFQDGGGGGQAFHPIGVHTPLCRSRKRRHAHRPSHGRGRCKRTEFSLLGQRILRRRHLIGSGAPRATDTSRSSAPAARGAPSGLAGGRGAGGAARRPAGGAGPHRRRAQGDGLMAGVPYHYILRNLGSASSPPCSRPAAWRSWCSCSRRSSCCPRVLRPHAGRYRQPGQRSHHPPRDGDRGSKRHRSRPGSLPAAFKEEQSLSDDGRSGSACAGE